MKHYFPAYYRINRKCIKDTFNDCLVVFDSSALLDIFRLPESFSEQIFNVIQTYKKQVRIPYHVSNEFLKDIHKVLLSQIRQIEGTEKKLSEFCDVLSIKRSYPHISESINKKLMRLRSDILKDFKNQKEYLKTQLLFGDYQNRVSELLDGCVLKPFTTEEINDIEIEGDERYKNHISPGWKDASKDDNRYGDLIIWKEILRLARNEKKSVLFVTNDQKEDWIINEMGMIICPQYDLLSEFYNEVGDSNVWFHIYTLSTFLDFIRENSSGLVSKETVDKVQDTLEATSYNVFNKYIDKKRSFEYLQKILLNLEKTNEISSTYHNVSKLYDTLKLQNDMMKFQSIFDAIQNVKYTGPTNDSEKYKCSEESAITNESDKQKGNEIDMLGEVAKSSSDKEI